MKRRNPEGSDMLLIGLAAGIGYWWWQKSATASAPTAPPLPATPAAVIAANAVAATTANPPNYQTGGTFDNGSQIYQCPPNNGVCCTLGPSPGGGTFVDKSMQPCASVAATIAASAVAAAAGGMIPSVLDPTTVPPPNANNLYQIAWIQATGGYQVWGQNSAGGFSRIWVLPSQIPNPSPPAANGVGICVSAVCPPGAKYFQI